MTSPTIREAIVRKHHPSDVIHTHTHTYTLICGWSVKN